MDRLWLWATNLSNHEDPYTRRYAPGILLKSWGEDKSRTERILTALVDDKHYLVREGAHWAWGGLLKNHFEQVFPILQTRGDHPSSNLGRCVAIAVWSAGNLRKEDWAEPLTHLLEPILCDKNTYVRKNLGPHTIGDGLLRCYSTFALEHLRKWALRRDEGTRWNVAMAFASYGGGKNWRDGMEILAKLATDERRYVWRSVASVLLYLTRRHPEVQDALRNWSNDSKRARAAGTALKHLTAKKAQNSTPFAGAILLVYSSIVSQ